MSDLDEAVGAVLFDQMPRPGDKMTVAGVYKRRTFWQWMFRQPRVLQEFHVVAS